jgi:hypothetical protein
VNIYFEDGTDVYFARQVVGESLAQARRDIPQGFGDPQMGPISTGLGIVFYFRIEDASGERSLFERLKPYSAGVYVNFMPNDEAERVGEAYGPNLERLAAIKAKYDPENFFRLNQNIVPAEAGRLAS